MKKIALFLISLCKSVYAMDLPTSDPEEKGNLGLFGNLSKELMNQVIYDYSKEVSFSDLIKLSEISWEFKKLIFNATVIINLRKQGKFIDDALGKIGNNFPYTVALSLRASWETSDAGLSSIQLLTNLSDLDLKFCQESMNSPLTPLWSLTKLSCLNLSSCNIGVDGLSSLQALPNLSILDLSSCRITDASLSSLQPLTNLIALDLDYCQGVTDDGLSSLQFLTNLTALGLDSCHGVKGAGISQLKLSIPKLEIYR